MTWISRTAGNQGLNSSDLVKHKKKLKGKHIIQCPATALGAKSAFGRAVAPSTTALTAAPMMK